MARNRPRSGEIARVSGQKHEEDTRNPKEAPTGPENNVPGSFFRIFWFSLGWALFRNFTGSPKGVFPRPVRLYVFVYVVRVSLLRPPTVPTRSPRQRRTPWSRVARDAGSVLRSRGDRATFLAAVSGQPGCHSTIFYDIKLHYRTRVFIILVSPKPKTPDLLHDGGTRWATNSGSSTGMNGMCHVPSILLTAFTLRTYAVKALTTSKWGRMPCRAHYSEH